MIDLTPTPEKIKAARVSAGLTQKKAAEIFGYSLRGWQRKEETGDSARGLTNGEYEFLLLLANEHPNYILIKK